MGLAVYDHLRDHCRHHAGLQDPAHIDHGLGRAGMSAEMLDEQEQTAYVEVCAVGEGRLLNHIVEHRGVALPDVDLGPAAFV